MCDEHGCRFRVAVFPFLHNLGPEYPFRPIHHRIMADCEDFGIDSFDLDPALSEHSDERLTVNPFDAHPNERAHEIAAEALTRWLSDKAEDSIGHQTDSGQSLERPIGD